MFNFNFNTQILHMLNQQTRRKRLCVVRFLFLFFNRINQVPTNLIFELFVYPFVKLNHFT